MSEKLQQFIAKRKKKYDTSINWMRLILIVIGLTIVAGVVSQAFSPQKNKLKSNQINWATYEPELGPEALGRWEYKNPRNSIVKTIIIFRERGTYFLKQSFYDGSKLKRILIPKIINGKRMYLIEEQKDWSDPEHYYIAPNGDLYLYSPMDGLMLWSE